MEQGLRYEIQFSCSYDQHEPVVSALFDIEGALRRCGFEVESLRVFDNRIEGTCHGTFPTMADAAAHMPGDVTVGSITMSAPEYHLPTH